MVDKKQEGVGPARSLGIGKENGSIRCTICAHACRLQAGHRGICGVRERKGDKIISLVYGRLVAGHHDPIEKKPLFHVMPGSRTYSIATAGCNFRCLHCQNASISQVSREIDLSSSGDFCSPDEVVESALIGGCQSISYTYVEPTIFFEYAYDCCVLAIESGLKNIFISNGYMTKTVIAELAPVLGAINIDLKSFKDSFYKKVCGARLAPVLENIVRFKELGIWVEVTTLVIPGMNDSEEELTAIASFLAGIDREIPWHISGFHPAHRLVHIPSTGVDILIRARDIGFEQGLYHVYTGNRPGFGGENTACPACGQEIVVRRGFQEVSNLLQGESCPNCGRKIAGIWI